MHNRHNKLIKLIKRRPGRMSTGLFCLAVISFLFVFNSCGSKPGKPGPKKPKAAPNHHALRVISYYQDVKKERHAIIPYRVNLMAIGLLNKGNGKFVNFCRDYIRWYLNHTNPLDKYDLSGTIYHYDADFNGKEYSLSYYHNIDATSASFILLLHKFYKKTGYKNLFLHNRKKIEDVAYIIPHLMDGNDGLIRTMPVGDEKLLENNCLCYAAMAAHVELIDEFGWDKKEFYQEAAEDIRTAVQVHLYRDHRLEFYWKSDGKGKYTPDWEVIHPDRYSQLFPMLFDVLQAKKQRRLFLERCGRYFDQPWAEKESHRLLVMDWAKQKIRLYAQKEAIGEKK